MTRRAISGRPYDAVFRMNYPPLANFEEYVGSKTTIDLVNHHHARGRGDLQNAALDRRSNSSPSSASSPCLHEVQHSPYR
jgi:hypothetical protein